jgi:hypothetical protein
MRIYAVLKWSKNNEVKNMLDRMHKQKIDMSGGIVVVGSHRGESTVSVINYAVLTGKQITYVETTNIEGMI